MSSLSSKVTDESSGYLAGVAFFFGGILTM
jgi:hypothetical protein